MDCFWDVAHAWRDAGAACRLQQNASATSCSGAYAADCQHPTWPAPPMPRPPLRTAASAARSALDCFSRAAVRADLGVEGGVSSASSAISWSSVAAAEGLLSPAGVVLRPAAAAGAAAAAAPPAGMAAHKGMLRACWGSKPWPSGDAAFEQAAARTCAALFL